MDELRQIALPPARRGAVPIKCEATTAVLSNNPGEALQDTGGVGIGRMALLSQEGSTIETAVEIVRGVVP